VRDKLRLRRLMTLLWLSEFTNLRSGRKKIKTYEQNNKSSSRFDLQRILVYEVKSAN